MVSEDVGRVRETMHHAAAEYGEITSSGERCESTWSGPFCASSSSTKTAVLFQNGDFDSASIIRPSARSLSAMCARGVGASARRARRVVVGQPHDLQPRHLPRRTESLNSASQTSARPGRGSRVVPRKRRDSYGRAGTA